MQKPKSFRPKTKPEGWKSNQVFNGRLHLDRLYDHVWERYSKVFLSFNPNCYSCGSKSSVVDHIQPHKGDEVIFRKLDNHLPLCFKCHNTVTALYDKKYIKGHSVEPKLRWLAQQRINYQCTTRVKVLPEYGG